MLYTILFVVFAIIAIPLILALFMGKDYFVQREVVINAPLNKVFDYLKYLKNQDNFNKWVMVDPNMKKEFKGTDGTIGFIYGWNGNNKAGEGEQEIKAIIEGKRIESEIRFVRPMPGVAVVNLITESISDNQTKVTWSNKSKMSYPMNLLIPMVDKLLGKDMEASLNMLKNILEK